LRNDELELSVLDNPAPAGFFMPSFENNHLLRKRACSILKGLRPMIFYVQIYGHFDGIAASDPMTVSAKSFDEAARQVVIGQISNSGPPRDLAAKVYRIEKVRDARGDLHHRPEIRHFYHV
jgi:hypothetical protein